MTVSSTHARMKERSHERQRGAGRGALERNTGTQRRRRAAVQTATPGRRRLYSHSERQGLVNVLYELWLVGGVLRTGEARGVSGRAGA